MNIDYILHIAFYTFTIIQIILHEQIHCYNYQYKRRLYMRFDYIICFSCVTVFRDLNLNFIYHKVHFKQIIITKSQQTLKYITAGRASHLN